MLTIAKAKFAAAGIDISQLRTTGDAAYFSFTLGKFCQGDIEVPCDSKANESCQGDMEVPCESDANESCIEVNDEILSPDTATTTSRTNSQNVDSQLSDSANLPTITGIFRGKDNYVFEIEGKSQKASKWRSELKEKLVPGWGTDNQPVYRTKAFSKKFGQVTLIFYVLQFKRAVSYLIVVGKPLLRYEALHTFAFHHRIEEFWKILKDTLELGDMHLRDREGAHACVAIKIISYLTVNMMKQNIRKLKCFKNVTINKLVNLCPKFVDVKQILKEHFHDIIPENYTLDKALA